MNPYLTMILQYLRDRGFSEETIKETPKDTFKLSLAIMAFVHRGRYLENGEESELQVMRCLSNYRKLLGVTEEGGPIYSPNLLDHYNIPHFLMEETILLHDALDSGEFTIDIIDDIFMDCNFDRNMVDMILERIEILHDDGSMLYKDYMLACLSNIDVAFVKLLYLYEKIRILDFNYFHERRAKRVCEHIDWMCRINKKFHLLDHIHRYREEAIALRNSEQN